MYYDDVERLRSLPASWTDVLILDGVITAGRGRAHFRADELWEVAEQVRILLARIKSPSRGVK